MTAGSSQPYFKPISAPLDAMGGFTRYCFTSFLLLLRWVLFSKFKAFLIYFFKIMRVFYYVCIHQKFLNAVFAPKNHDFFEFLGKLKNVHSIRYASKIQGFKSLSPLSGEKMSFLMKL